MEKDAAAKDAKEGNKDGTKSGGPGVARVRSRASPRGSRSSTRCVWSST
jgi:hypothetical protein